MRTVAKVFVVLNLLLAVAFLGAAATLLGNMDSYKTKLADERRSNHDATVALQKSIQEKDESIAQLTTQKNAATEKEHVARVEADLRKTQNDQLIIDNNKLSAAYSNAASALLIAQNTIKEGRGLVDQLQAERQSLINLKTAAEEQKAAAVKAQNAAELNLENA